MSSINRNEGYYVVVTFSAEPVAQAELERTLNLADEVLRHKVMVLPPVRDEAREATGIFPRLRGWRRRDTTRGVNEPWRRTTK